MRFVDASRFTADRAWGALDIAQIDSSTIRIHPRPLDRPALPMASE